MDFEFENKDEFEFDTDETNQPAESEQSESGEVDFADETEFGDIYEDISSNSGDSGVDIMGTYAGRKIKKRINWVRVTINTLVSMVLVLSVAATAAMGIYIAKSDDQVMSNEEIETGNFSEIVRSESADSTNFLVVGCDWTGGKLTDVIVVVTMDHKEKTVSMLQIPRDTYVGYINSYKVNSVYSSAREGESKIKALQRCLNQQLGIPIDHYILFSIESAVEIVDDIGGVEMNIPNAIRIEDPLDFGNYYNIGPGKVKLSGRDAIGFMRKRAGNQYEDVNYDGSDIGRVKQQRKFYAALFKELQNMSATEIRKVATTCFEKDKDDKTKIQTDLTLNESVAYALEAMKIDNDDIHIFGLPGQSCNYNKISYYSLHKQEYIDIYNKHFNPYGKKLEEKDVACPELHVYAGQTTINSWLSTDDSTLKDY